MGEGARAMEMKAGWKSREGREKEEEEEGDGEEEEGAAVHWGRGEGC